MEIVTRPHRSGFPEWAADKPQVVVLSADLTSSCEMDLFRDRYPDRFFSMGMAEQNMMGFAAGLAREGFHPWIHTFAVFVTRRPFDQVAMSIAYPNLPVRLVGFLPGITTPGGVTHQAIDDLALMRAIPNLTIFETGDATEVETILDAAEVVDGPVYIRMLRGEIPRLFARSEPFVAGQSRLLQSGGAGSRAGEIVVVSSGICTEEALRASRALLARGIELTHLHLSTIKPFGDGLLFERLRRAEGGIITIENHLRSGGVGTAVAEWLADQGLGRRLIRLGLDDRYAHGASRGYLMRKYRLDALALIEAVEQLRGEPSGVIADDLAEVRIEAVHSLAKAEGL